MLLSVSPDYSTGLLVLYWCGTVTAISPVVCYTVLVTVDEVLFLVTCVCNVAVRQENSCSCHYETVTTVS